MLQVGLPVILLVGSVHFVHSSLITVQLDQLALDSQSPPCRIKHRSNATNSHSVLLFPRETLNVNFCLKKATRFAIHGISYSNDGGGDTVTVTLDGKVKGEVNSLVRTTGGDSWNSFLNSGQMGDNVLLERGPHEVVLNLTFADRFGLELDSLTMFLEDNILPFDLRCFTSPKQWGHNSNIKRTCIPPENWTMKPRIQLNEPEIVGTTSTASTMSTSGIPTAQLPVQQTSLGTEQTTNSNQTTPSGVPHDRARNPPSHFENASVNSNGSSSPATTRTAVTRDLLVVWMPQGSSQSRPKSDALSLVVTILMFAFANFIS